MIRVSLVEICFSKLWSKLKLWSKIVLMKSLFQSIVHKAKRHTFRGFLEIQCLQMSPLLTPNTADCLYDWSDDDDKDYCQHEAPTIMYSNCHTSQNPLKWTKNEWLCLSSLIGITLWSQNILLYLQCIRKW